MTDLEKLVEELSSENVRLKVEIQYLEDSLTAAVTGELPKRYDLNQLLLASRANKYFSMLEEEAKNGDTTTEYVH